MTPRAYPRRDTPIDRALDKPSARAQDVACPGARRHRVMTWAIVVVVIAGIVVPTAIVVGQLIHR